MLDLALTFILKTGRPPHGPLCTMIRNQERYSAIGLPLSAVLGRCIVILEVPLRSITAVGKLCVQSFTVVSINEPAPLTVIAQNSGVQVAWQFPNGSSGGGGRVRVGWIVYFTPLLSEIVPPCFQFILFNVAAGLQPLLLRWSG